MIKHLGSIMSTLLMSSVVILVGGCGTFMGRVALPNLESINNGKPEKAISRYYPGVVVDAGLIGGSFAEKNPAGLIILLDVPFSFCADTILLPIDYYLNPLANV